MKIIDKPEGIIRHSLGNDGVGYFYVIRENRSISFRYLVSNQIFASMEVPSPEDWQIGYYDFFGDYEKQTWNLSCMGLPRKMKVSKGKITQLDTHDHPLDYLTQSGSFFKPFTGVSPKWFVFSRIHDSSDLRMFHASLKCIGYHKLAATFCDLKEQQLLIINRETGESNKLSIPVTALNNLAIALDEQTVAACGNKKIAIVDLDF